MARLSNRLSDAHKGDANAAPASEVSASREPKSVGPATVSEEDKWSPAVKVWALS